MPTIIIDIDNVFVTLMDRMNLEQLNHLKTLEDFHQNYIVINNQKPKSNNMCI